MKIVGQIKFWNLALALGKNKKHFMLWEPITWNLGLNMEPRLKMFYCHRFGQPMVHLLLD
jgi:hypothetical protein